MPGRSWRGVERWKLHFHDVFCTTKLLINCNWLSKLHNRVWGGRGSVLKMIKLHCRTLHTFSPVWFIVPKMHLRSVQCCNVCDAVSKGQGQWQQRERGWRILSLQSGCGTSSGAHLCLCTSASRTFNTFLHCNPHQVAIWPRVWRQMLTAIVKAALPPAAECLALHWA